MKRRKLVAILAAVMTVAAVTSATTAGAGSGTQTRGIEDGEILVGGLGPAFPFKDFGGETGAKARFEVENAKGGVNGRMINYVGWADDNNSAETNLAETQRLVQQDGVFALVPVLTPNFIQAAKFAEQQKVPAFGWGIAPGFCTSKYAFGFSGCLVPPPPVKIASNTWGGLIDQYFKDQGEADGAKGKTAAVISEANDSGESGNVVIVATAEAVGMKVVYDKASVPAPDPAPVTDFSPYVTDLMTSDGGDPPDVIFLVVSQDTLQAGLQTALDDAGFDGLATNAVLYSPLATALVKGGSVLTQFATPEAAATTPAVQEFLDAVEAVAGDEPVNQPTISGYLAADMFIQALKKAGKNPTPEKVQKAAAKLKYEVEGFVGPTTYPRGFKQGTPCGQLVASDGTEWTVQVPFQCFTNINVKTLKPIK
ncbi:MAG TPA: ABC transporter substrate-binding protein [Acidimicrobiia bacterium]|nr:ABC transporter substrate-binding protein [Acidimicrobiia bacterium]